MVTRPPRTPHENRLQNLEIQNATLQLEPSRTNDTMSSLDDEALTTASHAIEEASEVDGAIELTLLKTKYNERIRRQLRSLEQMRLSEFPTITLTCQAERLHSDNLIDFRAEFNQRLRQQLVRLREERERASSDRSIRENQRPL